jgi:hypothetical protein
MDDDVCGMRSPANGMHPRVLDITDDDDAIPPAGSSMLAIMTWETRGMAAARMVE